MPFLTDSLLQQKEFNLTKGSDDSVSMPFLTGSLLQHVTSMLDREQKQVSMPFLTGSLLQLISNGYWNRYETFLCPF